MYLTHSIQDTAVRAPYKVYFFIFILTISSSNPMFDLLLQSSHRDDSYKWSSIGFDREVTQVESIKVNFTDSIWGSEFISIFIKMLTGWSQDHVQHMKDRSRLQPVCIQNYSRLSIFRTWISQILRNSKRLSESKIHFNCFLQPELGV